ncbi:MAG: YajG family lipoprotein [Sideroxyarcus sp.]|nr:YajG family lipoprotein [Sideroxyarcus sp.]
MLKRLAVVLCLAILTGCSTTSVGLKYGVSAGDKPGKYEVPVLPVSVGVFTDKRHDSPTWLGAVRGGFGNPLKTLESSQPVSNVIQTAYIDALKAKGVTIDAAAPLQISGTILDLNCTQMAHREATAMIEVTVAEQSTGKIRLTQKYSAKNINDSGTARGVFASVEDLRLILEKTMREVVDKTLADSAFIAALSQSSVN